MSLLWVVVIMCRWIRSLIEIQSKYNSYFTNNEYVSMLENHYSRWTSELPITNKQLDLYIKFIYIYISLNLNPKINTILKINFKIFSHVSISVQYLKILFTLSNIAQFFITLFIFSKRMIENSEKDRISVFTFFTSLRLLNFNRTRQPEWLAGMPPELEVRSSIPSSVGFFAIFLHRHNA